MKLKYLASAKEGLPLEDSYDNQRIVGILQDDGNIIVMYVDRLVNSYFIERVINKFAIKMLSSSNFAVITDEEYQTYDKFFKDQGVMKLWRSEWKLGKMLLKKIVFIKSWLWLFILILLGKECGSCQFPTTSYRRLRVYVKSRLLNYDL